MSTSDEADPVLEAGEALKASGRAVRPWAEDILLWLVEGMLWLVDGEMLNDRELIRLAVSRGSVEGGESQ